MRHLTTERISRRSIATWLTIILSLVLKPSIGQVYPVQATINVTPPYTVYLSHYTAPDQQRVMATVLLRDPVVTSIDVFVRFTIEGPGIKIYTNPSWKPAPLSIQTGIPVLIPASIIAECLRPQNIVVEGMSPQELYRGGKLPEGYYQFRVEVFEYNRGVPISNVGRAGVWLLLNEPPRLVFPASNQKVNATNPQFINFSWVPGGIASPLSAQNTMYEFTMVELMGDVDPNVAITTAPDALKFTRTLQQTTLLYGPGEPPLIPGKRYAYRVRAYNTDGYEIFKNNGYSEVRVFQFGDACLPPTMFTLKDETQNSFDIEVVADPGSTAWQAQFREGDNENATWSELKPETTNTKTVKGLKASTAYQVQLKSVCGTVSSGFTPPQTITTKQKVNTQRSCDNSVSPFVVQQAQPLKQLKPNNIFLAALIPIRVTEVTKQGGGKFTGKGVASLPLVNAGLAVTFTDIGINELMQLTSGEVVVERNAVNITLFGDTQNPGGGTGDGSNPDSTGNSPWPEFTDTLTVDSDIDSVVVVNDSTVWVYTSGGTGPIVADLGGNDCLLIVPADGNMDRAVVVYNGAAQPYRVGSGSDTGSAQQLKGFRVWFTPAMGSQFGYDSLRIKEYSDLYNDLFIDSTLYKLPWKALAAGIPEPVEMHVRRGADSLAYSTLKVLADGKTLTPTSGANTALQTYNLIGTSPGDEYPVLASYSVDDKKAHAGGLWTATYQKKGFTLYVVPLSGTRLTEGTVGLLQNYLNQIYSQAVVSWNVQAISGFPGIDLGDNGLDHADNEMLSAYNPEMNRVISAFKDWHGKLNPEAAYLFLVPKADGGLQGYMPFNRQFGFVVVPVDGAGNVDAALLARTAAHELGHGIFSLRHTFSTKNFVTLPQGTTDNLMDYSGTQATKLYKYQWDYIHDPQTIWFAWTEEEEEGEMASTKIQGTPVIYFGDSAIKKERLFIYNDTARTIKVKFETSDTTKREVAYKLITDVESTSTKITYPKSGYDTIITNQIKEIRLDSIPVGKYTLECKIKVKTIKNKKEVITENSYSLSVIVRKKKLEITTSDLIAVFGDDNKDTARLGQVARAINKYAEEFGIVDINRMAHFLGQIGAETGGLKDLKEDYSYSPRGIVKTFPYPKYGHLFEIAEFDEKNYKYNYKPINYDENKCDDKNQQIDRSNANFPYTSSSEIINAYAEIKKDTVEVEKEGKKIKIAKFSETSRTDVNADNLGEKVKDKNYNSGKLRVKEKYIRSSELFDVVYACRMGNGTVSSKEGSKFAGKGFIHLTGKDCYKAISDEWNRLYPNDPKEFHGKDIELLETNIEIAIKASMVYWKMNNLNQKADAGIDETSIDNVGRVINGSGKGLPNNYKERRTYSKLTFETLK